MASSVAAAGAAVAFYFYSRKAQICGFGGRGDGIRPTDNTSHFEGTYQAPSTWLEALLFFAEALRYMYNESLGRWRTADLLIGLAYLARQETKMAVADIAAAGQLVGQGLEQDDRDKIIADFKRIAHFMKYCQVLRERSMPIQTIVLSRLGVAEEDIFLQQAFAGMLKPSYVLVRDHRMKCVVLAIRGTHSVKDMFTSLTSASKPHHMVAEAGVVLGYSHFGMLAAARWVMQQTQQKLQDVLESSPGYHLQVVGHSLGAGTAALLTTRLREVGGVFAGATCLAIACPACMTIELAQSCGSYVTTIINGHDMIPTLSPGAADALRTEVMQSSWYEAFRADMRSSIVVRAVEASVGSVGSVTSAASSITSAGLSAASRSFRACYQRRGAPAPIKRSESDSAVATAAEDALTAPCGRIEIAKDWVDPQEEAESPSWSNALRLLEPFEPESSAAERHAVEEPLRSSWPSTSYSQREEEGSSSRSKSIFRKAGDLWSKVWLQGCRTEQQVSPFQNPELSHNSPRFASDFASSLSQPILTTSMQMERSASDGPASPIRDPMSPGSAFRAEIAAAHRDLETEAQRYKDLDPMHEQPQSCNAFDDASAPNCPTMSPTRGPQTEEGRRWRRMTYPAGRIYHLVPARLVYGEAEASSFQPPASCGPPNGTANASGSSFDDLYEGVVGFERPENGAEPFVVINTSQKGRALGLAPPIPPVEDFVLLENVPQEVYGRIRLCSRMLADHFIPSYLGSLETALKHLEAGYPELPIPQA